MAQGQNPLLKEIIEFVGKETPANVAAFLIHNANVMRPFLFGEGEEADERFDKIIYQLEKGIPSEQKETKDNLSDAYRREGHRLFTKQNSPQQPKNSILDRIKQLSWPIKIGIPFASLTTAGIVALAITHSEPNEDFTSPSEDPSTASQEFEEVATSTPTEVTIAIDGAVNEALQQTPITTVENFDPDNVEGLHLNSDGNIYYHDWIVPLEVYEANIQTAQITGLPLSYMFSVQSLESSFDPNAFNGIRACGLSQFVPSTLAEKAYRYADLIGYEGIRNDLIVRTRAETEQTPEELENNGVLYDLTYDYANLNAQHTLVQTCWDPDFNTRLAAVMQIQDIGRLQRHLAEYAPEIDSEQMDYYPVTELHGYVAHFAGGSAGRNLLQDFLSNEGNSLAHSFFSDRAKSNKTNQWLLYHPITRTEIVNGEEREVTEPDQNNPRTVAEFFTFLEEEKGLSNNPLPDFTDWPTISAQITVNMDRMNISPTHVELSHDHVFGSRPQSRPENLENRQTATLNNG